MNDLMIDPDARLTAPISDLPLLVPARVAGPMCGRAEPSWWRDHAAARCPAPVRIGRRTLWRTQELRDWVEAGCPDRKKWEAMRKARATTPASRN